jgi:hypothetical protein
MIFFRVKHTSLHEVAVTRELIFVIAYCGLCAPRTVFVIIFCVKHTGLHQSCNENSNFCNYILWFVCPTNRICYNFFLCEAHVVTQELL